MIFNRECLKFLQGRSLQMLSQRQSWGKAQSLIAEWWVKERVPQSDAAEEAGQWPRGQEKTSTAEKKTAQTLLAPRAPFLVHFFFPAALLISFWGSGLSEQWCSSSRTLMSHIPTSSWLIRGASMPLFPQEGDAMLFLRLFAWQTSFKNSSEQKQPWLLS